MQHCKCEEEGGTIKVFLPKESHQRGFLIAGYVEHGLGIEALCLLKQMQLENVVPYAAILVCALESCASIEALDEGQEMHNDTVLQSFGG